MNLLIDTFSWKKIGLLSEEKLINIDFLHKWSRIYITHEVKRELEHFEISSCNFDATTILPIKNNRLYQYALDLGFDQADSEIFSNSSPTKEMTIVSEDKPLLKLLQSYHVRAIQLIDLFYIYYKLDFIKSNDLFKINKYFREKKNITEKKYRKINDHR
ncbi:MAG: hypothetical protein K9W44_06855 [Candidatus Lokiarchaeota archaeon]|nr:hypothetical protein [Candidatus Harpocratesius repetitus]